MPKIRTNETYVSVRDFARGHGIDPAVFLEQVKRHIYDSGITLDDRIWSDNLVKVYNKMNNESVDEATLMIRGGKPTGLLEVVDRIAQTKNKARAQNLQGIYSHYMALSQLLTNTAGIKRELVPGKPYYEYSITDDLYRQYVDACKALKLDYYTLDGQLVRNAPSKPSDPAPRSTQPSTPTNACIPFDQCFYAKCWPDAEDYGGDPEYSWIKPGNLKETLRYFDPEGEVWDDDKSYDGFLDRHMPELKAAYDKAVKEYAATGKAKTIEVGNSYDRVPKDLVPGLTTLYTVWPRPEARGARYQRECSLYMAIGPRDKFKF